MHYMVDLDGHLRRECSDDFLPNQSHQQPNNAKPAARLVPIPQQPRTAPLFAPRHRKTQDAAPDRSTTALGMIASSTKEQNKSSRQTGN